MKLRAHLAALVLVTLLPVVVFAAIMVALFARHQQETLERATRETARALSLAVDRELEASITTLQALATSRSLDGDDLAAVRAEAERIRAVAHPAWSTVALVDPAGQIRMSLASPAGTALPAIGDRDYFRAAVTTRQPAVSDLLVGRMTREPLVAVAVPVVRGKDVRGVLVATVGADAWSALLAEQRLPPGWAARILDRAHVTVARAPADPSVVGRPPAGGFAEQARGRAEGWVAFDTRRGRSVHVAFTRSRVSGWLIAIAIPSEMVTAPLRRSLWAVAGGGLAFVVLGVALAAALGRRLTRPIHALSRAAAALERGEPGPPVLAAGVREVDRLAAAIRTAAAARLQAEAALRESRARWLTTLRSIGDAVIATDAAGRVTFLNPVAEALTGWRADEAIGAPLETVFRIVDEAGRRPVESPAGRILREGGVVGLGNHTLLLDRAGREIPVDDSGAPIRDEQGAVVGAVLVFRDVTARRQAETARRQAAEEAERRRKEAEVLADLVRSIGAAHGLDAILQHVVDGARDLTRADLAHIALRDPATGTIVFRYWSGERRQGLQAYEVTPGRGIGGQVLLTGRPFRTDDYQADPRISGDFFPTIRAEGITASMAVPIGIDGEVGGLLFVDNRAPRPFTDRDEALLVRLAEHAAVAIQNVRLLARTEAARAEAEAASRAKDHFLAMLGHELRNPLGAIANAMLVLERLGKDDERAVELRAIVSRQIHHLSRLVDDLLDVTRLETGKIQLQRTRLDLRAIAERGVASLHEAGKTGQHTVELIGEPVVVEGDATRLEQVLWNLLDNAIKYTPAGGRIAVTVTREGGEAVLRVRDTGAGIAPELLPRIFDLFVQADASLDRAQGGLGLGLTLVRRLVALHGGQVEVASAGRGQGSVFTVRLPALEGAAPSPEPSPPAAALPGPPRRVLVIEDNTDVRDGLRLLLEELGHEVVEAADGDRGVAVALDWRPDVALVDLGLPGLDGYAVARRIRAAPGGGRIRLVALTGYGQPEDRRRALEAGFDAHLVKPADADALLRLLAG